MKYQLVNTSRKGWVDALRGLAILLVIYGHNIRDMHEFFVFTSPFKMPLFFAITGYVFVLSEKSSVNSFFSQLFRKIFIPWMILGLLPELIRIPSCGVSNVFDTFLKLLSGEYLWFMPCFFIGEIIWYFTLRLCKKTVYIATTTFVLFAIGLVLHHCGILNYAMFNRALAVQPFFLIGYIFRNNESYFTKIKWGWLIAGIVLYVGLSFLSMFLFPGESIDVHLNQYYNLPYCLLLIFLSCFLLFTIASKSGFNSPVMSFIGQNTLVLYIWHPYLIMVLIKVLSLIGLDIPYNWWTALVKVAWSCVLGGACAILLNRFLPVAVGKTKKHIDNNVGK